MDIIVRYTWCQLLLRSSSHPLNLLGLLLIFLSTQLWYYFTCLPLEHPLSNLGIHPQQRMTIRLHSFFVQTLRFCWTTIRFRPWLWYHFLRIREPIHIATILYNIVHFELELSLFCFFVSPKSPVSIETIVFTYVP